MNFEDDPLSFYSTHPDVYREGDESFSGSDELLPPEIGESPSGSDDGDFGEAPEEDSFEEPDRYVTTFSDFGRVSSGGGTDNRFKTPEEKAIDRLSLVYEMSAFSGMEKDETLIKKLSEKFGTRLPTLNLHTLLATAIWVRKPKEKWSEATKDKEFRKFCGPVSSGGMDIDAADVMRYEMLLETVRPKIKI